MWKNRLYCKVLQWYRSVKELFYTVFLLFKYDNGGGITQRKVTKMEQITIKGKIEFCEDENKEYNGEFTVILRDSGAFAYGNQTAVIILWGVMANGMLPASVCLDTRYDRTIKRNETDFKKWVQLYFKDNHSKHILTIY